MKTEDKKETYVSPSVRVLTIQVEHFMACSASASSSDASTNGGVRLGRELPSFPGMGQNE